MTKKTNITLRICFIFLSYFFVSTAFAIPKILTIQTKIIRPDGTLLDNPSVNFQYTTLANAGACVLYVEQFNSFSMAGSGGIAVMNLGSGTQVFSAAGSADYSDIFANTGTYNCQGAGTYNPAATDRRRIIIQFNDGSGSGWQTTTEVAVNSVPYANYAGDTEKFSGKIVTDFLLSTILPGAPCTAGQSMTYTGGVFTCVANSGSSLPSQTGNANKFLRTDGTNASWVAEVGTVSNVTSANSYITVATGTSTPVITAVVGTAANTLAAGNDTRFTDARPPNGSAGGDLTGTYPNPTLNTVPVTKGGTGKNTNYGNNSVVVSDGTGTALTSLNCTQNQVIKFDSSGYATCSSDMSFSSSEIAGNLNVGTQATRTTAVTNRGQLATASTYIQTTNLNASVNWNNGNQQEINTFLCDGSKTITMTNIKDGAAYTLLLSGTAAHSGACVFSAGGFTFKTSGGPGAPVPSKDILFTFAVVGTTVIYNMVDNLQ